MYEDDDGINNKTQLSSITQQVNDNSLYIIIHSARLLHKTDRTEQRCMHTYEMSLKNSNILSIKIILSTVCWKLISNSV
jgi:hypothetical protein